MKVSRRRNPHDATVPPWEPGDDPQFVTAVDALAGSRVILRLVRNDAQLRDFREGTDDPESFALPFSANTIGGLLSALDVCMACAERSLDGIHDRYEVKR